MNWYYFEPRPSVAERRANAILAFEKLKQAKKGAVEPIIVEGRKIAQTFWGKAWCDNLESYRDFEYRLPRGRSYVRNRAVLDLKIEPGRIEAVVHGSSQYDITIDISALPTERWRAFKQRCSGRIDSLIGLLKGELSEHVIKQIIDHDQGLFPAPDEINMRCSCPDWAVMCKHVAAAMYGVGHRLDSQPDLLFKLRQLDPAELIDDAGKIDPTTTITNAQPTLDNDRIADVFGINLADDTHDAPPKPSSSKRRQMKRKTIHKKGATKQARSRTESKTSKKKKATKKTAKKKVAKKKTSKTKKKATPHKTATSPARKTKGLKKKK